MKIDKPLIITTIATAIFYAFIAIWIFCLLCLPVRAGVATNAQGFLYPSNPAPTYLFAWNPSLAQGIGGYRLYMGVASAAYTNALSLGNVTNATVTVTRGSTYYFAVTAYTTNGLESQFSNEISVTPANLPAPVSLNSPVTLVVQHSPSGPAGPFEDTQMVWSIDPSTSTNDFFRLHVVAVAPAVQAPTSLALPLGSPPPAPFAPGQ